MNRPTYHPLKGRASGQQATRMTCVRDVVAQTTLKVRKDGQGTELEVKESKQRFRDELLAKEAKAAGAGAALTNNGDLSRRGQDGKETDNYKNKSKGKESIAGLLTDIDTAVSGASAAAKAGESSGAEGSASGTEDSGFDSGFDSSEAEEGNDDNDDDDDEDDEEALQLELNKIRAERAEALRQREESQRQAAEAADRQRALSGNPLISGLERVSSSSSSGARADGASTVKRRWNDDVVFKGQARDEPEVKKRFINDTTRSDFHRSFMKKYIK